jgi:hypothetical protein
MFFPLYPIGIASEWWLLLRAIVPAGRVWWGLKPFFWACLALYGPGGLIYMGTLWKDWLMGDRVVYDVHAYDEAA